MLACGWRGASRRSLASLVTSTTWSPRSTPTSRRPYSSLGQDEASKAWDGELQGEHGLVENSKQLNGSDAGLPVAQTTSRDLDRIPRSNDEASTDQHVTAPPESTSGLVKPQPMSKEVEKDKSKESHTTAKPLVRRVLGKDSRRLLTPRQVRSSMDLPRPPSRSSPSAVSNESRSSKLVSKQSQRSANVFWMDILKLLWDMPISRPERGEKEKVYLSYDTLYQLAGAIHANNWIHPVRDGCHVAVQDHNWDKANKRLIYLTGSPRAIELTKKYLLREEQLLHPEVTSLAAKALPDGTKRPQLWRLHAERETTKAGTAQVEFNQIREPTQWTIRTFADYVEDLVANTSSSHLNRIVTQEGQVKDLPGLRRYGDPEAKKQMFHVVAARLSEIFGRPELQHCISTRAQDRALSFLTGYYQLRPGQSLNVILSMLSRPKLEVRTRLFNKVLGHALQGRTVGFVKGLFDYARELQVPADAETGLQIFQQTTSAQVKMGICRWMVSKDFFSNSHVTRRFASMIIPDLCQNHFSSGLDARSFFLKMDEGIGSFWLSKYVVHQILDVCATKKYRQQAEDVLAIAKERGLPRDPQMVNSMLKVYYRCSRPADIVNFLNLEWVKRVGREDRFAIPYAFMTAWNTHYYNLCRVLWHYAAVKGVLTYQMRQIVYWSLVRNSFKADSPWQPKNERTRNWRLSAGKVVAGIALSNSDLAVRYPDLYEASLKHGADQNPMKWTVLAPEDQRQSQLAMVKDIIHNDQCAVMHVEPAFKLSELLIEAHHRDIQWKQEAIAEKGVLWMIDHAIEIPLKPRSRPLEYGAVKALENTRDVEDGPMSSETFTPIWKGARLVSHD